MCTVASENIHENNLESRGDVHSQTPQYMAKVRCQRRAPSLLWYQNCHPPFSLTHWAIIIPQWLFGCRIPPPALGLALAGCSLVHPPIAFSPPLPPGNALLFVFFFLSLLLHSVSRRLIDSCFSLGFEAQTVWQIQSLVSKSSVTRTSAFQRPDTPSPQFCPRLCLSSS